MPSGESWFGIITSIASPLGCHFRASCRYPPMVVICGNNTLIARAAQMVLTCNPFSGATPTGSTNWNCWAATGASAVSKCVSAAVATWGAPASAGRAIFGWLTGAGLGLVDAAAAVADGVLTQHRDSVVW